MTDHFVPSNREQEPSSSLLRRVQAQEQPAWDRLVHLYSPLVYAWCRGDGLQEADALDVAQEVFETVWRKVSSFRRRQPGDSFRGWLRTMTRNKLIDYHRRQQVVPEAQGGTTAQERTLQQPAPPLPEPDADEDNAEASLLCHRAVALIRAEFEETSWLAFEAVVMREQKPADVAEALHVSVNAVYLAKSRILHRLRQEFADLIDF